MHAARETLQTLLGREIVLHPSADGVERFLTAELSGDYAGVVRLAMLNNRGGGHPLLPSLNDGLRFQLQEIALIA